VQPEQRYTSRKKLQETQVLRTHRQCSFRTLRSFLSSAKNFSIEVPKLLSDREKEALCISKELLLLKRRGKWCDSLRICTFLETFTVHPGRHGPGSKSRALPNRPQTFFFIAHLRSFFKKKKTRKRSLSNHDGARGPANTRRHWPGHLKTNDCRSQLPGPRPEPARSLESKDGYCEVTRTSISSNALATSRARCPERARWTAARRPATN
jgi:hypothetical protein